MQTPPLNVLLVEDHPAVLAGLAQVLGAAGMRISGIASGVEQARALLRGDGYDVALVDIRLGADSAIGVVEETLRRNPGAAVVLYTGYTGTGDLAKAVRVGTRGFALKSSPIPLLVGALRSVAAGGHYVDPGLAPLLVNRSDSSPAGTLSRREREILGLLAEGLNGQEIAERLFLSPETVRTHVRNGTAKLGARTRVQAVALMLGRAA